MSTQDVEQIQVPGNVVRPPAPGSESAGPALADLVAQMGYVTRGMEALVMRASREARNRTELIRAQLALDANAEGAVKLFEVPQGAEACLTWLTVDVQDPAVHPTQGAKRTLGADEWHALYSGGSNTAAQFDLARGSLLMPGWDILEAVMFPFMYPITSMECAPRLKGPEAFWFVKRNSLGGGTPSSNQTLTLRGAAIVYQPEL